MIRKPTNAFFNSRGIIDACKPFEWINEFPTAITTNEEAAAKAREKWGSIINLKEGRRIW